MVSTHSLKLMVSLIRQEPHILSLPDSTKLRTADTTVFLKARTQNRNNAQRDSQKARIPANRTRTNVSGTRSHKYSCYQEDHA